jgi:hypothetical protein
VQARPGDRSRWAMCRRSTVLDDTKRVHSSDAKGSGNGAFLFWHLQARDGVLWTIRRPWHIDLIKNTPGGWHATSGALYYGNSTSSRGHDPAAASNQNKMTT